MNTPASPASRTPSNFRDLSERARPRLPLRPGILFRSDHLGGLCPDGARHLAGFGLRRVIDLRGRLERLRAPCALPGVEVLSLPIEPTVVQVLHEVERGGRPPTAAEIAVHLQDTYRDFVRRDGPRFAEFFAHLLASDAPTVFHCTAGKDRTGLAAALLLHALGAPADLVMEDYLLTNQRLRPPPPPPDARLSPDAAAVLWSVRPGFLQAALDAAREHHGSLDGWLRGELGVGPAQRQRLRAMYLRE